MLALLRPSFIKEPLSFTATTPPNTLKTFVSSNSYSAPPAKSTRSGAGTGASGGGGSGSSSGSGGFGAGPNARGFSGQQWAAVGGWGDAQVSYSSRFRPSGRTEGWRPANGWLQVSLLIWSRTCSDFPPTELPPQHHLQRRLDRARLHPPPQPDAAPQPAHGPLERQLIFRRGKRRLPRRKSSCQHSNRSRDRKSVV